MARVRDTRTRDRALFITVGLFAVLAAYAGHEYFASDAGRLRAIVAEARARQPARALAKAGCDDPKVFTSAEVAQLVHLGKLQGVRSMHGVHLALCLQTTGRNPSCESVGDAYVEAGGALPVHVLVMRGNQARCSVLRVEPPRHGLELEATSPTKE
jgi:hypothetical protein